MQFFRLGKSKFAAYPLLGAKRTVTNRCLPLLRRSAWPTLPISPCGMEGEKQGCATSNSNRPTTHP